MRDKILSLVVNWLMIMMMNDVNILYCCNSEPEYLDPAEVPLTHPPHLPQKNKKSLKFDIKLKQQC